MIVACATTCLHCRAGDPAILGSDSRSTEGSEARMRVYISVDMEGIGGISPPRPTERGGSGYPAPSHLMTGGADAATEGGLSGGAPGLLVHDRHGGMGHLSRAG